MSYEVSLDIPNIDALLDKVRTVGREMGFIEREVSRVGQSAARETSRISASQSFDPGRRNIANAYEQSELSYASRAYREDKQSARSQIDSIASQIEATFTGKSPKITGPNTRFEQARDTLDYLKEYGGTQAEYRDAQLMYDRAQKQVNGPTMQDRVMDLIGTTRIGGNVAPLVNRLANVIPGGGGIAGMGAAAGLAAMAGIAEASSRRQGDLYNAHYLGGGPIGGASAIARLTGESVTNIANQAVQFGDQLREGGYGAAYMRAKGMYDTGVYQTDKTTNYVNAIKALANEQNESTAIRVARDLGMSDKLWLRDLPRGDRDRYFSMQESLMRDQDAPNVRRTRAKYEANKAAVGGIWDKLMIESGDFFQGKFNAFMEKGPIGAAWDELQRLGHMIGFGREDSKPKGSSPGKNRAPGQMDWGPNVGRAPADESFGGIGMDPDRYRGAVPAGWKYLQMDEAMTGQAKNLGAFTY